MKTMYENRINYKGPLEVLLKESLTLYDIGSYTEHKVIETGYEDLNIKIETNKGLFLIKFFAQVGPFAKSYEDACSYVAKIVAAMEVRIQCPKLYRNVSNSFHSTITVAGEKYDFCVQEFIAVATNSILSKADIVAIASSMAQLHTSAYRPNDYYDEWCVLNFAQEYPKLRKYLEAPDKVKVKKLFAKYKDVTVEHLPKAFIHADLLKSNVLKAKDGQIYLIDFSVAFYGPRILDVAVVASNLTFYPEDIAKSNRYLRAFIAEYEKLQPLTEQEKQILPQLLGICFAMYVMLGSKEIASKKEYNDEDYFWRDLGRAGLKAGTRYSAEK